MKQRENGIIQDIAIVLLSVAIAVALVKTHTLADVLASSQSVERIGSFIAGMFFTSVFTTAPAIVALGEIARANSLIQTAFLGALGAMAGDFIIFRFIRDRFSGHLAEVLKHAKGVRRVKALFRLRIFRWFTFLVGGLIIASPLPDELGIGLLGFAHMSTIRFLPFSFFFNFVGILVIGIAARSLS